MNAGDLLTISLLGLVAALSAPACGGSASGSGGGSASASSTAASGTGGAGGQMTASSSATGSSSATAASSSSTAASSSGSSAASSSASGPCGDCMGLMCCGTMCVNADNDINHCGNCANTCPQPNPFCNHGICTKPPCDPGTVCAGVQECCGKTCCSPGQLCCAVPGPGGSSIQCVAPTPLGTCPTG